MNRATTTALRALVGQLILELEPTSALATKIRGAPLPGAPAPAPAPARAAGPWDIRQELGPADRVVMLSRPLERPVPVGAQPSADDKPRGLFYSIGPAWLDFAREVLPAFEREHHYKLTLDRARLVVINSDADVRAFAREFGAAAGHNNIDWRRVAASGAGGIEVAHYFGLGLMRGHVYWSYSWDVPSGVVWDDSVILAAEMIPRQAPFVPHVPAVDED